MEATARRFTWSSASAVLTAFLLAVAAGVFMMATSTGFAPILLVPVAITAVPLVIGGKSRRAVRIIAAALLGGWVLLSIASVGLLYVPSALLIGASAARP